MKICEMHNQISLQIAYSDGRIFATNLTRSFTFWKGEYQPLCEIRLLWTKKLYK